jgi:hypothetical protein
MRARATAADSEALGIVSSGGVDAVFERVKLSGIEGPAISLEQAAELVASDVAIERAEKDCIRIHGANGDFTRVSIDGCEGDAVFIRNSINTRTAITRVTATFSDLAISGTTQQSRAGDAPAAPKEADDAAVHVGKFADVTLRRFRITDNEVRAGRIEATARLFLEGGRVERNTSGMEVEDPDLDLADLLIGVSYDENGGGPAFIPRISGE